MAKLVIVSNRLPIKVANQNRELQYQTSEGGLATGLSSVRRPSPRIWVGWPGVYLTNEQQRERVRRRMAADNMVPLFLSKQEIRDFYEGFSNQTLWPNFHYFPQFSVFEHKFWDAYVKVNEKFCQEVLKVAEPGDTVWVQDYQLMLLPMMLREKLPDCGIGFFLHIPFPSFEIFRLLPWRVELLKGVLGADLIGFHTYDYMRHFLSALTRLLKIHSSGGHIEMEDRLAIVDAFPMGIDYEKYAELAASKAAEKNERKYRRSFGNQQLILSIDRLDYSKGIAQRLRAFRLFLEMHPEYHEKVSLVQIVVPSRDKVEKYLELKREVNRLVGTINAESRTINWTPVHYFYRSFPPDALAAFYRTCDVALVTPMRDGMNLVAKEYIASRVNKDGVLILSEMAGAAVELSEAVSINSNDIPQIAEAIHLALNMPKAEQKRRMEIMQRVVQKFNVHHWVELFMERLEDVREKQKALLTRKLCGAGLRRLEQKYSSADRRLLFLDYDGTLMPFHEQPAAVAPDEELCEILRSLSSDPKNRVAVISGRDKETLEKWLGKFPIDLIAEHGVWLKQAGEEWELITGLTDEWKREIYPVLDQYANRTPGAFIEEKNYSLVWHYRKVETGLGELRSRELINHLRYLVSNTDLQVLEGDKVVEVKSVEVNKGRAAKRRIKQYKPDFILAIGDDWTDEDVFRAMPSDAFTVKVRGSVSAAKYRLKSHVEVRRLLKYLYRPSDVVACVAA